MRDTTTAPDGEMSDDVAWSTEDIIEEAYEAAWVTYGESGWSLLETVEAVAELYVDTPSAYHDTIERMVAEVTSVKAVAAWAAFTAMAGDVDATYEEACEAATEAYEEADAIAAGAAADGAA